MLCTRRIAVFGAPLETGSPSLCGGSDDGFQGCFASDVAVRPFIMPGARGFIRLLPRKASCAVQAKVGKYRIHDHAQKGGKDSEEAHGSERPKVSFRR